MISLFCAACYVVREGAPHKNGKWSCREGIVNYLRRSTHFAANGMKRAYIVRGNELALDVVKILE